MPAEHNNNSHKECGQLLSGYRMHRTQLVNYASNNKPSSSRRVYNSAGSVDSAAHLTALLGGVEELLRCAPEFPHLKRGGGDVRFPFRLWQ